MRSRHLLKNTFGPEHMDENDSMKESFTTVMADVHEWRSSHETMDFNTHAQQSHNAFGQGGLMLTGQRMHAAQLRVGFKAWQRNNRIRTQEKFAASCANSCADLWKLGNAFDWWLQFDGDDAEEEKTAETQKLTEVNPYANALRRKRYSTPNRSRRGASPRSAQSAPAHQNLVNTSSPAARTLTWSASTARNHFDEILTPAEIFRGATSSATDSFLGSPLSRLTRDAFSDHLASPSSTKRRSSPPGTRSSFSVSYSFAEKTASPKSKPANGIGSGRFTRVATDTTPWRGKEGVPWYNSKTASCFRHQAWPECHAPPEGYARRDVSWQEWQRALRRNAESNAAARARDWRTRRAWLNDRRENTPSKIVPWHVEDGDYSHRNLLDATGKLDCRASATDNTVAGDELLGRTVAGWSSFIKTREHALSLEGMELVLNP